jgi:hypothetical protein
MSGVVGLRLADGSNVVVKVRPPSPRLTACLEAQAKIRSAGFPCPELLTGLTRFDGSNVASAERYWPGGAVLPSSGRSPAPFAAGLGRLLDVAPAPGEVGTLRPPLPWTEWSHAETGFWPAPDHHRIDLNAVEGPRWLDDAGRAARDRLAAGTAPVVVGHGDWYAGNLRWDGDDLWVVHDWDSVIVDTEAAIIGFAAAVYPAQETGDEATVAETEAFVDSYGAATGRVFSSDDIERAWAAGLWLRAFFAKKQSALGQPVRTLTEGEARVRRERAGA